MTDTITAGGEIDSYCTKCRLNLGHIIVAMIGEKIAKVKCTTCGSIHRFRDLNAPKPAPSGKARVVKVSVSPQAFWETAVSAAEGPELPYDMERAYRSGDIIVHSIFGKGIVQKTLFRKCAILFKDKERVLVSANS